MAGPLLHGLGMGRFEPTGEVNLRGLEHSVVELPWGVLRGALGPSDGSVGAGSNVPSALAVLRHAVLYAGLPGELDEAFEVLERHAIRHRLLYPVAVTVTPFLFDIVVRGTPVAAHITDLIAEYAAAAGTLEPHLRDRMLQIVTDHSLEIADWVGRYDRGAAALAIHVPALRQDYLAALERAAHPSWPITLLALLELEQESPRATAVAMELLEDRHVPDTWRMAAAAYLARFGVRTPDLRTRIDAALPPSAPAALGNLCGGLWMPIIDRPVVAPKLHDAEVVFAGERLVLVRAGDRSVTLPWVGANVHKGDQLRIGITAHGQPKLVLVTDPDGSVRVIDF